MKTLIELYDDRPIENVLATEVFRPERTVFLCPSAISEREKQTIISFMRLRGIGTECIFFETNMYYTERIASSLRKVISAYPDCVIDITGGTDAALFACGVVCETEKVPAFTYSRRQGCFFDIRGAAFAERVKCEIEHSVADCFAMTGGALREGRVAQSVLSKYEARFEPFFELYLKNRSGWAAAVDFFQTVSQNGKNRQPKLNIDVPCSVKNNRGRMIKAPKELIEALGKIGMLRNVSFSDERVRFTFFDAQVCAWLRDVGSVLELYVYKKCRDTGLFGDVCISAVVDWEGDNRRDNVTNEIDVMAMKGILPVFISCKTCPVTTEALNELAILRDRFGGKSAKAAIVTTRECGSPARHRAAELGITVIDSTDLRNHRFDKRLRAMLAAD